MPDVSLAAPALALEDRARRACAKVAPLWPLRDFVAVNPFLGLSGQRFGDAAATLRRVAGRDLLPPRDWTATAIAEGRVTAADLAAAGAEAALARAPRPAPQPAPAALTVADVLDGTLGTAWGGFMVDEIGKWVAAWADEGQAAWPMPWKHLPLHAAWRAALRHDRAPEVAGLRGFRAAIADLPEDPLDSIAACLLAIGLPQAEADDYLHRALLPVAGWAGLLRQRGWGRELAGGTDDGVLHLLAIRLAWDAALFGLHRQDGFRAAWATRLAAPPAASADLSGDLALLEAQEAAFRRHLAAKLARPAPARTAAPAAQAVFCIDVRSEVYRRALEAVAPEVETLGFAGFFGFAADYVRFGDAVGSAQFPVLLSAGLTVREVPAGAAPAEAEDLLAQLRLRRRLGDLLTGLRASAVSCFAYVETLGFAALAGLARGVLRRRPGDGALARMVPDLAPRDWQGRKTGMATQARVDAAETVLRAMSLTGGFGGLVLLVGHGAETVNNPHAAGLDCGACGGHTGESNARIAAAVLNDPLVRQGLAARGIAIPADTWFLAALHETVTDAVRIFDADRVPPSQAGALAALQARLAEASRRARRERAAGLGLDPGSDAEAATRRRGADWSEVRPEWALANNAAFIAAPRSRTAGVDLAGRAFLHSYDWQADAVRGFPVLTLIMTAPMVVANWINLQYYGSTVDNAAWGSGNKALHNVTGLFGVLEGQGGDLRAGLPWQSVHDGARFVHEPLRLQVLIEAPETEMDRILAQHAGVRTLVEHGWLHLHAIRPDGGVARRHGPGDWRLG
ncbi:YbcC family protein [Paracraurococcus ruber]|uniref:Probable inorganic carbon transporter subunit DabA n=1 Tax=Paracraurococcus ruber TaxID=77675 RepID=A0ABS1CYB0_9PROT|nr:DUF2309 domain-containing protein [Paracraurococcus ruber]MBK1659196.1 hypothetical protein [Paracraurococcus ruber]TDG32838.1 DUF2309 domain-containing protein [Paracraurococcus ruber]